MKRQLLLLLFCLLVSDLLFAATKTWTGSVSTAWNVAGNWSPSGIPEEADNIIIPSGKTVTVPDGYSRDIYGTFENNGTLILASSATQYGSRLAFYGSSNINKSTGIVTLNTNSYFEIGTDIHFTNEGTINVNTGLNGVFYTGSSNALYPFVNTGTLNINPNGVWLMGGYVNNSGTINANGLVGGTGSINTAFTNPVGSTLGLLLENSLIQEGIIFEGGLTNNGLMEFDLRGLPSQGQGYYDYYSVTGTATLGGTFNVNIGSFTPTLNTTYDVIEATAISGAFSNCSVDLGGGRYANVYYTSTKVQIKIENTALTVCTSTTPTITAGTATGSITSTQGTPSANYQQFTVSGSALTGNVVAIAPTNFEISTTSGSGYAASLTLTQTSGTVSNTTVYVRSSAAAPAGGISGNVSLTSTGVTTKTVAVAGTISAATPTITLTPASATYTEGQSVTVTVTSLTANTSYGFDIDGDNNYYALFGNGGNEISLASGVTSGSIVGAFAIGSAGTNRKVNLFFVTSGDIIVSTPAFEILPAPVAALTLTTSANPTTLCVGGTASLSVNTTGGTTPYTYAWTAPTGATITGSSTASTVSVSATTSGTKTFTVTVTGSGGSPVSTSTVSISVTANPTVTIAPTPSLTFCLGGTVSLSASGAGTGGSYRWSTTEITPAISVSLGQQYSVTATTSEGCSATTSATTTRRSLPTATVSTLPNLTVCPGQSVTLSANAVTGAPGARVATTAAAVGLTYRWSTGSNIVSTVFTPASSTVISLTVSDGFCSTSAISTSVVVRNVSSVSITASSSPTLTCNQPSITLTAAGSSNYTWDDNSTNTTRVVSVSGVYSVTATGEGCSTTASTTVSSNTVSPSGSISGNLTICVGESTTLTASGGTGFSWSNGINVAANPVSPMSTTAYSVTVTNLSTGCFSITSVEVTVNPAVTATISGNLTICAGESTTLTASGGTGFSWSNGINIAANPVSPMSTTAYSVTVSSGGCSASTTATVTVNPAVTASISGNLTICAGGSTTLTASGGTGFSWSNGINVAANPVSPVSTTAYSVTVTNLSTGCSSTTSVTVTVNPAVTATISGNLTICAGGSTTLTASGGTGFSWSNGVNVAANPVSPVSTTAYSVTVSSGDCSASTTATVTVNPAVTATIGGNRTICAGQSTTLLASGGTSFSWSNGVNVAANPVSPLSTTAYSVTVSSGGCSASTTATVTVNSSPTVTISASSTNLTGGQSATLSASGADSYTWSTPSTNTVVVVSPVATTVYSVTGRLGDCVGEAIVTVSASCAAAVAKAISVTVTSVLGPGNCSVNLQGQGTGSSFVFTGPGGYVFSTVYRRAGTYSLTATAVKQPGTYTMTASSTNACGQVSTDSITYVITGTPCP